MQKLMLFVLFSMFASVAMAGKYDSEIDDDIVKTQTLLPIKYSSFSSLINVSRNGNELLWTFQMNEDLFKNEPIYKKFFFRDLEKYICKVDYENRQYLEYGYYYVMKIVYLNGSQDSYTVTRKNCIKYDKG